MIAEFIEGRERFYSINALIREEMGGMYGIVSVVPLRHEATVKQVYRMSGALTEEDTAALARLFGDERFFIPPAPGCYSGIPREPVTRAILLSLGGSEARLHIRCTPLTDMLDEIMTSQRACLVRDLIASALRARQDIIICGRSGIGKTRLLVTCVFPHLPTSSAYLETLPELVPILEKEYPPPNYQYYTIIQPGLTQRAMAGLGHIIQYLRSSAPEHVVLQEAHTQATGYATPTELAGLVSSGVPFTITAHPSFSSPTETAEYYREVYGIGGASTVLIQLGDSQITFVHATTRRVMVFCIVPFGSEGSVFTDRSRDLPEDILRVILLTDKS